MKVHLRKKKLRNQESGKPRGLIMNSPRLQPGVGISRGQPVYLLSFFNGKAIHRPDGLKP